MLELKPLKTFDEMLVLPARSTLWMSTWARSAFPGPTGPGPLTSSTKNDEVPRSESVHLSTLCRRHLLSLGDIQLLPLWNRMSRITQPRSWQGWVYTPQDLQRVGKGIRFWTIVVEQLCKSHWNSCVFPGEKDFLLKMLDWMHLGYPENLGMYHNFLKVFFFFPSPSFTLVLFRTEILESEILPIPINMTFWTSHETERKPNVITQPLKFHHVVIHQRNWRCCTFLNLNMPSERLHCHVTFIKKGKAIRGIFTVGQSNVVFCLQYQCSLDQYWYHCVWRDSVSSFLFSSSLIFAVILETIHSLPVSYLVMIYKIIFKDYQASKNFTSFKTCFQPLTKWPWASQLISLSL